MRFNDVIYLIHTEIKQDELGNSLKKRTERMVYANKYQVSLSEFYSENLNQKASQTNIRPKANFMVRTENYEGEREYRHKDKIYEVLRVSDRGDWTLLVGVEKVGKS